MMNVVGFVAFWGYVWFVGRYLIDNHSQAIVWVVAFGGPLIVEAAIVRLLKRRRDALPAAPLHYYDDTTPPPAALNIRPDAEIQAITVVTARRIK